MKLLGQKDEGHVVRLKLEPTGNAPLFLPACVLGRIRIEFVYKRRLLPERILRVYFRYAPPADFLSPPLGIGPAVLKILDWLTTIDSQEVLVKADPIKTPRLDEPREVVERRL